MTAITFHKPAVEDRISAAAAPSSSPLRLRLAPAGTAPALIDGAWWPRSRDLAAELPALTTVLDPLWGRITHVTVNPTLWPVVPRKVPVQGHVVNVGWFRAEQDPHKLLLLSYTEGRWDLLVIPPETSPRTAARLMITATDPARSLPASGLIQEAEVFLTAADADWDSAREGVWDSEGGHDVGRAADGRPARAVIGHAPNPAEGM